MTDTAIGDIIFENNSTLFEVLDELQVPNLGSEVLTLQGQVSSLNTQVQTLSQQLSQLSGVVDNNQNNNNSRFVAIETQLDNLSLTVSAIQVTADSALLRANQSYTLATTAQDEAAAALNIASSAQQTADNAINSANLAQTSANDARSIAETAQTDAASAVFNSNFAINQAGIARTEANFATVEASNARSLAQNIQDEIDRLLPLTLEKIRNYSAVVLLGRSYYAYYSNQTDQTITSVYFGFSTGQAITPVLESVGYPGNVNGVSYSYIAINRRQSNWNQVNRVLPVTGGVYYIRYGVNATNYTAYGPVRLVPRDNI